MRSDGEGAAVHDGGRRGAVHGAVAGAAGAQPGGGRAQGALREGPQDRRRDQLPREHRTYRITPSRLVHPCPVMMLMYPILLGADQRTPRGALRVVRPGEQIIFLQKILLVPIPLFAIDSNARRTYECICTLFSSPQKAKSFQNSPSHRIL